MEPFRHSRSLDGLRFFAFFLVFLHHAWQFKYFWGEVPFVKYGYWGVTIFFVLSGFLIGRILLDLSDRVDVPLGSRLGTFYIRRALRIFPLYYLSLAVLIFLRYFQLDPILPEWKFPIYWHATYLTNLKMFIERSMAGSETHFWSLCIEEHFYLLAPLVLLTVSRRGVAAICVALWIGVAIARAYIHFRSLPAPYWVLSPMHFDSMSIGIAIAIADMEGRFLGMSREGILVLGTPCAVLFCILMAGLYHPFPGARDLYQTFSQPLLAMATGTLVLALWHGKPARLHRLLELRPLAYLGKISYALYLFHPMALAWIPDRFGDRNSTARAVLALLATIALASVSWRFFEKPINDLKDRFRYPTARTEDARAIAESGPAYGRGS